MKLYLPAGSTQASCRGMTLTADADGAIDVNLDVLQDLLDCGCTTTTPAAPLTPKQQKVADKIQAAAQSDYDTSVKMRDDARAELFSLEGRGDVEAVKDAGAALESAEILVKATEATL